MTPTDSNKKRATVIRARFLLLGHLVTMRSEVDNLHQLSLGCKRNLTIAQAQRI